MGNVGGGGYSLGANTFESLLAGLQRKYKASANGNFGVKGTGNVRVLEVTNPDRAANDFFTTFSAGGRVSELSGGKGYRVVFDRSTKFVVYRPTSKSGGPVIEIFDAHIRLQKIHFEPSGVAK